MKKFAVKLNNRNLFDIDFVLVIHACIIIYYQDKVYVKQMILSLGNKKFTTL